MLFRSSYVRKDIVYDAFKLDDKVAIVTGSGEGVGFEMARALRDSGTRGLLAGVEPRPGAAAGGGGFVVVFWWGGGGGLGGVFRAARWAASPGSGARIRGQGEEDRGPGHRR